MPSDPPPPAVQLSLARTIADRFGHAHNIERAYIRHYLHAPPSGNSWRAAGLGLPVALSVEFMGCVDQIVGAFLDRRREGPPIRLDYDPNDPYGWKAMDAVDVARIAQSPEGPGRG